jgi:hypothetical protein
MPSAQHHYPFEGKSEFESSFPADFICEAIDQTRGWFYPGSLRPDPSVQIPPEHQTKPQLNELQLRQHPEREPSRAYSDLFDDDLDAVAETLHAKYSRVSLLKMCWRSAQEASPQL